MTARAGVRIAFAALLVGGALSTASVPQVANGKLRTESGSIPRAGSLQLTRSAS